MRTELSLALLVTCSACSGADHADIGASDASAPTTLAAPPRADAGMNEAGLDAVRIGGRLVTEDGVPIVGRSVVLVDARGARTEILSDDGGAFWIANVVVPYDLAIEAAPSGPRAAPTVFFGLARADPVVELSERDGPPVPPAAQTLRMTIRPPACRAGPCTLRIVSTSASGSGAATVTCSRPEPVIATVEHAWSAPAIPANETIELHALWADEAAASFAYARRAGIAASAGGAAELGAMQLAPVAATGPLVVHADAPAWDPTWSWSLETWLRLPGGGSMTLGAAGGPDQMRHLPVLAGAAVRVGAWARAPSAGEHPYFERAAQAWSGTRPIAAGSIVLDVARGPVGVRPTIDGTLSRGGVGIAWANPAPTAPRTTEATMTDVADGKLAWRVFTMGEEIPRGKLERLGIDRLDPGDHVLALTSTPGHTVEELVDGDPSTRHARFDVARAGTAAYERYRFRVTP